MRADASPSMHRAGRRSLLAAAPLLACAAFASALAGSTPLPVAFAVAAFVLLAVESDLREHRIPNWLTFPALAAGLLYAGWIGGGSGALEALLAVGVAFGLLIVPYATGALGAGDVKAVMALAALLGSSGAAARLIALSLLAAGLIAVVRVALAGELGDLARRSWRSLSVSLLARRPVYFAPAAGTVAAGGIPFALAIALALAAHPLWEVFV